MYMKLYYLEDLSLGEIAGEYGVSRQAVYDNVRRTEEMLEDYEAKLKLFSKFQNQIEIIEEIEQSLTNTNGLSNEIKNLLTALKDQE